MIHVNTFSKYIYTLTNNIYNKFEKIPKGHKIALTITVGVVALAALVAVFVGSVIIAGTVAITAGIIITATAGATLVGSCSLIAIAIVKLVQHKKNEKEELAQQIQDLERQSASNSLKIQEEKEGLVKQVQDLETQIIKLHKDKKELQIQKNQYKKRVRIQGSNLQKLRRYLQKPTSRNFWKKFYEILDNSIEIVPERVAEKIQKSKRKILRIFIYNKILKNRILQINSITLGNKKSVFSMYNTRSLIGSFMGDNSFEAIKPLPYIRKQGNPQQQITSKMECIQSPAQIFDLKLFEYLDRIKRHLTPSEKFHLNILLSKHVDISGILKDKSIIDCFAKMGFDIYTVQPNEIIRNIQERTPSREDIEIFINIIYESNKYVMKKVIRPKLDGDHYLKNYQDWILSKQFLIGKIKILNFNYQNLQNLPDFSHFKYLKYMYMTDCKKLKYLPSELNMTYLESLYITHCPNLKNLPNMTNSNIRVLYMSKLNQFPWFNVWSPTIVKTQVWIKKISKYIQASQESKIASQRAAYAEKIGSQKKAYLNKIATEKMLVLERLQIK